MLHVTDATITWMMGVVSGLQDMAQVLDAHNCRLPNYYMHKTTQCACNDTAVRIPLNVQNDSKYWCTGTLRMLDEMGNPVFIYNEYTYEQLRDLAAGMDSYLACVARLAQDGVYQVLSPPFYEITTV